jgi:hypothetical protein
MKEAANQGRPLLRGSIALNGIVMLGRRDRRLPF